MSVAGRTPRHCPSRDLKLKFGSPNHDVSVVTAHGSAIMSVIPQSFGLTRTDRLTVAHECCFSGHRPALLQRKHSHANTSQSVQTSALATRVPGLRGLVSFLLWM